MRIALIGTRGIPARYGGFETCAEEVAVGLAALGHSVVAYCRPGNAPGDPAEYRRVSLVYRDFYDSKSFGTITHTANSLVHALRQDFDVLMIFNAGNGPLCFAPKLLRRRFAINVDGLEWKRAKWGRLVKLYYQFAELCSARTATRIVSDSRAIQAYYDERFRTPSTFIAYGGHVVEPYPPTILGEYDLQPQEYLFVASRLEPENNADITIEAFSRVKSDKKLVIAGGANWESGYVERLNRTTDPRVKLLGPVYKDGHIEQLHLNCYAYVHGNEVGGTNPALLKALGYGNCVLALNVAFNAEVVQDAAVLYDKDPALLAQKMQDLIDHPDVAADYRRRAPLRIKEAYQWDAVVRDYERLFERIVDGYYDKREPASD
jgi:glycosyltransferase involved in cell wall biosynthesis